MCLQELHKTDDPLAFLKSSLEQKSGYIDLLHLQAFFKNYREHNPWESVNTQANRNGKAWFPTEESRCLMELELAALPFPTWWTVSLNGRVPGVSELEFSTWWFPSANSGSRCVSCETESPSPPCTKWSVFSLPLWFSIPPFDIAILHRRHNFKSFGCFRTRKVPSLNGSVHVFCGSKERAFRTVPWIRQTKIAMSFILRGTSSVCGVHSLHFPIFPVGFFDLVMILFFSDALSTRRKLAFAWSAVELFASSCSSYCCVRSLHGELSWRKVGTASCYAFVT